MYEFSNPTHPIFLLIYPNLIMWKIKKQLLEDICTFAKNNYPFEFLCFLSGKNELIEEFVFIPNNNGEGFVEVNLHHLPLDPSIIGSIHSHPDGQNHPSQEDKKFFQNYKINGIINYSFTIGGIKFYDNKGKEISVDIV